MDALVFNFAINKVIQFGQTFLRSQNFVLAEIPATQEDSGDLVSTESITIRYRHISNNTEFRIFLCCGKGQNEDYIDAKLLDLTTLRQIDFSILSDKLCYDLNTKEFNTNKKPMEEFLENYFTSLREHFAVLNEMALFELTASRQGESSFNDWLAIDLKNPQS